MGRTWKDSKNDFKSKEPKRLKAVKDKKVEKVKYGKAAQYEE